MRSACGASVIEVPRSSDFEIDVEDVLAALTPSTKLIVIVGLPEHTDLLAEALAMVR